MELLRSRVVHGGRMKCHRQPGILQTHHELFPAHTGVMRCLAHSLGGAPQQSHKPSSPQTHHELFPTRPNRLHTHTHSPKRLAHPRSPVSPLSTLTARATHARQLHPAALASVLYGAVLVRVRVRVQTVSISDEFRDLNDRRGHILTKPGIRAGREYPGGIHRSF